MGLGILERGLYSGALGLVVQAGPVAKAVLLVLFLASVFSWAVIIERYRTFRRAERETERFLKIFRSENSLSDIYQAGRNTKHSPLYGVFEEVYRILDKQQRLSSNPISLSDQNLNQEISSSSLSRVLEATSLAEMAKLERYLTFLATIGSVSPFVGLLGTVWGVMTAFMSIGIRGSASIGVVAPGIAEALITTAAGLAAAIPAVIAYNHFVNKTRNMDTKLESFLADFIVMTEKGIRI